MSVEYSFAWEQDTHIRINLEAIKDYLEIFEKNQKDSDGLLNAKSIFKGVEVSNAALLDKNHKISVEDKTYAGWIIHGGYAADEPNLYASVRHFYDPLALSGKTWLTDQVSMHGTWNYVASGDIPEIDAKVWGLSHEDNPYSYEKGLQYYYKAMTTPIDQTPVGFKPIEGFRTQAIPADTLEVERNMYLGAAFRALGEAMHLMADMTQPAHVRNDSHPVLEPLEQNINKYDVQDFADRRVDSTIAGTYISAGGSAKLSADQLVEETARYTNKTFFSADTIYDYTLGIMPKNGEGSYSSPQLSQLIPKTNYLLNSRVITGNTTYFSMINGDEVPLARVDLLDRLETEGLIQRDRILEYGTGVNYNIPPSMAKRQGEVLIPVAIAACADLMDRFLPSLTLESHIASADLAWDEKNREKMVYTVQSVMTHHIDQDVDWAKEGLKIQYSGPGRVVLTNVDGDTKSMNIAFTAGAISHIQDVKDRRKFVEGPLKFYFKKDSGVKLTKEEAFFKVAEGDRFHVEVEAGGRVFKTEDLYFDAAASDLEITYKPEKPSRITPVDFSIEGDDDVYYRWEFGDGTEESGQGVIQVSHQYEQNGDYEVKVTAYSNSDMKTPLDVARKRIQLSEAFEIVFIPGNNLSARAGDWVEIGIAPKEESKSFNGYTIQWIVQGAEGSSTTDRIQLSYPIEGRFTLEVKVFSAQNEQVASGSAVIDVGESAAFTVEPMQATVNMNKFQRFTAMLDGKPISEIDWHVKEGPDGGVIINVGQEGEYRAPVTLGVYTVVATLRSDPSKFVEVPITVVRPKGAWVLSSYKKEEAKNRMGNENYPWYSGSSSATDNTYNLEVAYNPPAGQGEAFSYSASATWDVIPERLLPNEVLKLKYTLGVDGDYEHGKLSFAYYGSNSRGKISSFATSNVRVGGLKSEEGIAEFKVPEYGDSFGQSKVLSFRISVDPFYQYANAVNYYFEYVYEE
jgi:hypothetical protein